MQYKKADIGRVFIVRFEHGDDFLEQLNALVKDEEIGAGLINFIGSLESSEIVVGDKEKKIPPDPIMAGFDDQRELVGIGTIFWKGDEPKIHLHAAIGRQDLVNIGCIRKNSKTFLIIEAIIFELKTDAKRAYDRATGLDLLSCT